jgi:hypothetical protein
MTNPREVDVIGTGTGQIMQLHPARECLSPCPVHSPSTHPLAGAALHWRSDRRMWERICEHGVGHPDPDDLGYKRQTMMPAVYRMYAFETHGCDGCCDPGVLLW